MTNQLSWRSGTAASCTEGNCLHDSPRDFGMLYWPRGLCDMCAAENRKQVRKRRGGLCRKLSGPWLPFWLKLTSTLTIYRERSRDLLPSSSWSQAQMMLCADRAWARPFYSRQLPFDDPWPLQASEQPLWSSDHIRGAGEEKPFSQGHYPVKSPGVFLSFRSQIL